MNLGMIFSAISFLIFLLLYVSYISYLSEIKAYIKSHYADRWPLFMIGSIWGKFGISLSYALTVFQFIFDYTVDFTKDREIIGLRNKIRLTFLFAHLFLFFGFVLILYWF
jgi:hypothetical protein